MKSGVCRLFSALTVSSLVALVAAQSAHAAAKCVIEVKDGVHYRTGNCVLDPNITNCQIKVSGKTHYLQNSCTTDQTITIPAGFSFTGGSFTITAVDPAGGHFVGPVLKAIGGKKTNIQRLTIQSATTADVCETGDNRMMGILFDNTPGAADFVNISMQRAPGSACPDGLGVVARNVVAVDPKKEKQLEVRVKNSMLIGNQWRGIQFSGHVFGRVERSTIQGVVSTVIPDQIGIEIINTARALVTVVDVNDHAFLPLSGSHSFGVLVNSPVAGIRIDKSNIKGNDTGIRVSGGNNVSVISNRITLADKDGILLDDADGLPTINNKLTTNDISKNKYGIRLKATSGLVTGNLIKQNTVTRSKVNGILIDADGNRVEKNTVTTSTGLDIVNIGNSGYKSNLCDTNSGAPITCGVVPPGIG